MLFAVGQALFIMGDVITYNYDKFFGTEIPFPSWGDPFYLGVYPCLIAGIVILIRRRNPGGDRDSLIDSLIITLGPGAAVLDVPDGAVRPRPHAVGLPVKLVSIAYPLMDFLLLAVTVRLAVSAGRRETSFYLLAAGVFALLVTDVAYGLIQLSGVIYENGGPLEAGWLSFYLLLGAAALHPSMASIPEPGARAQDAVLPRPAGAAGRRLADRAGGPGGPGRPRRDDRDAGGGRGVDRDLPPGGDAHGRHGPPPRAGRGARARAARGGRGVRGRHHPGGAVLRGHPGHAGARPATARRSACTCDPHPGDPMDLVAEAGKRAPSDEPAPVAVGSLPSWIGSELSAQRAVEVRTPEPALMATFGLERQAAYLYLTPLFVAEQMGGLVAVARSKAFSQAQQHGLDALASQTALALESTLLTEDLHRRQSEARFASLVQNSSDVVTVILADSTIKYQSPSAERVMGYQPEDLVGTRLIEYMVHTDDVPRIVSLLAEFGGERSRGPELVEFRWRHKDGRWLHVESLWSDLSLDPTVGGIVLNTRDISERKLFEQQLAHQAFHDSITGLANRALFRDRVEHALSRQQRDDRSVAVLFMDIDDFKTINDSLGHAAGDRVLEVVGDRISDSIRTADTAARLGGDEFAVLLEDADYNARGRGGRADHGRPRRARFAWTARS